jgi:hypothetical protein
MVNHLWRILVIGHSLFLSLRVARILLYVGLGVEIVGAITAYFGFAKWIFIIGLPLLSVYWVAVIFMLPSQLVAFVSSRQYVLLPNIRGYLSLWICISMLLSLVAASCFVIFIKEGADPIRDIALIALAMGLCFSVMVVFVQLGAMQMLYWPVLMIGGRILYPVFLAMPAPVTIVMAIVVWIVFFIWWSRWQPKKYLKSIYTENPQNMSQLQSPMLSILHTIFPSRLPKNIAAGILFGQYGARFYQVKIYLVSIVFLGLILGLVSQFDPRGGEGGFNISFHFAIAFGIIQIGYVYVQMLFKNIHKLWLYYGNPRLAFFFDLERLIASLYLPNMLIITAVAFFLTFFLSPTFLTLGNLFAYIALSLFVTAFSLYLALMIYAKWSSNIVYQWINGILMTVFMGGTFAALSFMENKELHDLVQIAIATGVVAIVLLGVMRAKAKKMWRHVNFVRVTG